jgi:NO-binding membrane sensor protein with MHYT domain
MTDVADVYHFTYGYITLVLSYGFSVLGSLLALVCTARAQAIQDRSRRARWLVLAAWALGGTGIWVMHFTAMLGFTVPDSPVRYDVTLTVVSWVAAIVVVGIGLFVAGFGRPSVAKVILGGTFAGSGVAIMHYFGMAAMHVDGTVGHDRRFVAAAGAIGIAATIVALWFTVTLRRGVAIVVAAFIAGLAVNGMHYTGMAGVRIHLHPNSHEVAGTPALSFLGPMLLFVLLVVVTLAYALLRSTAVDSGRLFGPEPAFGQGQGPLRAPSASMPPQVPTQRIPTQRVAPPAPQRSFSQQWEPVRQRRPQHVTFGGTPPARSR